MRAWLRFLFLCFFYPWWYIFLKAFPANVFSPNFLGLPFLSKEGSAIAYILWGQAKKHVFFASFLHSFVLFRFRHHLFSVRCGLRLGCVLVTLQSRVVSLRLRITYCLSQHLHFHPRHKKRRRRFRYLFKFGFGFGLGNGFVVGNVSVSKTLPEKFRQGFAFGYGHISVTVRFRFGCVSAAFRLRTGNVSATFRFSSVSVPFRFRFVYVPIR